MKEINHTAVNAIRILSADGVQKANSGHPGLPLGSAAMAYELWANHMNHNPKDPHWINRDRFVLSAGHGSMMLYSLLHLFGYGVSIEDLKGFRQWGSKTPGHPEYGHTVGVETTTGPLGAGMSNAVGFAMAETHLASIFNRKGYPIVDHYTFVLGGDGCMMEGITSEAMSLAGTLGLSKLIVMYDSNQISIEGSTDLAFRENVQKRFKAYGFQVLEVEDGNDLKAIAKAIEEAKADDTHPSFIEIKTKIGFGSPKEGSASAHGEPLGVDNVAKLREKLGWENQESFAVSPEIYQHFDKLAVKGARKEDEWNTLFENYKAEYPELAQKWDVYHSSALGEDLWNDESFWAHETKPQATRNLSGVILNKIKDQVPNLFGGSADLAPSTKTNMKDAGDFSKENTNGANIHFGVRELAMAGIGNGILIHGGLTTYVSTFFVFADYMKPMMRLASIMNIPMIYILTHDSIGVGEDGPTHEPIEQLSMLRSQPNLNVFRPADAVETAAAWYVALTSKGTPTVMALSRQNLVQLEGSSKEAVKGAYIVSKTNQAIPDGILIASGSEVGLAVEAQQKLSAEGIEVSVVSMPCQELFDQQSTEYQENVLPMAVRKRLAIEAGASQSWYKYVGLDGKTLTIDHYGASAPGEKIFEEFGFTVEHVVELFKSL